MKYILAMEEPYEGGYPIGVFNSYEEAEKEALKKLGAKYVSEEMVIYKLKEDIVDNDAYKSGMVYSKEEDGTITSYSRSE